MFCGMDRVISQAGAYDESYGEISQGKTGEGVALKYYDTSEHGTRYLTRLVILYSGQQFCRASLKRALKLANAIYPLKIRRFRSSFATSKIFNQFRSLRNPFGSITQREFINPLDNPFKSKQRVLNEIFFPEFLQGKGGRDRYLPLARYTYSRTTIYIYKKIDLIRENGRRDYRGRRGIDIFLSQLETCVTTTRGE